MTATCHLVSQTVAQDMIQSVVVSICDGPGQTEEQRASRVRQVVSSIMAFAPRDPVEIMLAGMVVANFHRIMDATHRAFAEVTDMPANRVNSGIVALERGVTSLLKELRVAQNRPLADAAEASHPDTWAEPVVAPAHTAGAKARQTADPPALNPGVVASREDAAPVPLQAPLRQAETSVAAMLAMGSPITKPVVVGAGSKHVATPPPVGAHASPDAGEERPENGLPGLPRMAGIQRSAPEREPVARSGA